MASVTKLCILPKVDFYLFFYIKSLNNTNPTWDFQLWCADHLELFKENGCNTLVHKRPLHMNGQFVYVCVHVCVFMYARLDA